MLAEFFGFVAAVLGVVQAWPQARRVRALGHSHGVSISMWMMMSVSSACWLGYGLRSGSPSLIASTVASGFMNMNVVVAVSGRPARVVPPTSAVMAFSVVAVWLAPSWVTTPVLFAFTLSRLPQVARSWDNKRRGISGSAVSVGWLATGMACLVSWEVYSVLLRSPVLIGTTTVALMMNIAVAWLEMSNRAGGRREAAADGVSTGAGHLRPEGRAGDQNPTIRTR